MAEGLTEEALLQILRTRGFARAEAALRADLEGGQDSLESFGSKNAPGRVREAAQLQAFRERTDPGDAIGAYEGLREFCYGSLDLYREELTPVLLPVFVHLYLQLVNSGYLEVADQLLLLHPADFDMRYRPLLHKLAALRSKEVLEEDEAAQRWLKSKYRLRMSKRGYGLFLGWLEASGSTYAASAENEGRGRDRILRIVNQSLAINTDPKSPDDPLEVTALDPDDADATMPLALAPYPDEKLDREVAHETAGDDLSSAAVNDDIKPNADLLAPDTSQGPHYPVMRVLDLAREVARVREGRKRIRLSAQAFQEGGPNRLAPVGIHKPSVCLFTVHDASDALSASTISEDATLLATGFSESYMRIWSLKGDLRPTTSDFDPNSINTVKDLKKLKPKASGLPSRKLIGHSGPVYSLAFDPSSGSAAPPRHLLSASQDSTVRLWSLDTYSNLVVYRGHRDAIWDLDWGPRGIYFATASRDRTARLWTTERTDALRMFAGHLSDVEVIKFHPNSVYLATGSADRTVRLWDVQRGNCVRLFVGHEGPITALAFSPDGQYLCSGSEDLTIILWDLGSGKAIKTMRGHGGRILSLTFSNESSILISSATDRTIRVWDIEKRDEPMTTNGNIGTLESTTGIDAPMTTLGTTVPAVPLATEDTDKPTSDLLTTLLTKRTPVHTLKQTQRNLTLAIGPMQGALGL